MLLSRAGATTRRVMRTCGLSVAAYLAVSESERYGSSSIMAVELQQESALPQPPQPEVAWIVRLAVDIVQQPIVAQQGSITAPAPAAPVAHRDHVLQLLVARPSEPSG